MNCKWSKPSRFEGMANACLNPNVRSTRCIPGACVALTMGNRIEANPKAKPQASKVSSKTQYTNGDLFA